ncbi:MAG: hypothetical protein ACI8ZM_003486 [Crocinitomix sp.]|jgi:hypothetical protein
MKTNILTLLISSVLLMTGCMANLRPSLVKKSPNSTELENKGKEILQKAYDAHGSENLLKHEVYRFTATDDWKGMLGTIGKIWPEKNTEMEIKFAVNTFDAQVKFMSGEQIGNSAGLQSWNFYEGVADKANFDVEKNDKYTFGMAAFQYFIELVSRMNNANIIRYAGETEFNNKHYDLVYVTWNSEKANKDVDQYLLYIDQSTHILDYASFTIRENYINMPGASALYGSIGFSDYRNIDGYLVPFTQTLFSSKPKKNNDKYLHQLKLKSFVFDDFKKSELYPNKSIKSVGDSK